MRVLIWKWKFAWFHFARCLNTRKWWKPGHFPNDFFNTAVGFSRSTLLSLLGDAKLGKFALGSGGLWLGSGAAPVRCAVHAGFCGRLELWRLVRSLVLAIHWPHVGSWLLLDQAGLRSQGWRKVLDTVATTAVLGCHGRRPVLGLKTYFDIADLFGPWLLSANPISEQGPERALWCCSLLTIGRRVASLLPAHGAPLTLLPRDSCWCGGGAANRCRLGLGSRICHEMLINLVHRSLRNPRFGDTNQMTLVRSIC